AVGKQSRARGWTGSFRRGRLRFRHAAGVLVERGDDDARRPARAGFRDGESAGKEDAMNVPASLSALFAVLFACLLPAATAVATQSVEPGRVRVENVEVRQSPLGPVVLLKVRNKAIPVFVDAVVAESIQSALTGKKTPRPLTHELMRTVLEAFDGKVTQVVVTLKDRTFYAALTVA